MEAALDFESLRVHLMNGIEKEITDLKEYLTPLSYQEIEEDDGELVGSICERIVYAAEGIKKLSAVLGFMDCWEEHGEPPQLNRNASFMEDISD